jgi:hypothetical protein
MSIEPTTTDRRILRRDEVERITGSSWFRQWQGSVAVIPDLIRRHRALSQMLRYWQR